MIEGIAVMHVVTALILLMILLPAALVGIAGALIDAAAHIDCLSTALPHASALLAEMAPLAPALALLLAGATSLVVAAWLIVRVVNGG